MVFLTYDLNQGPFRLKIPAVVILASAHGNIFWFPLTAVAGTVMTLLLAQITPAAAWMNYMGRNALTICIGLNGVFYHHINGPARRVDARKPWACRDGRCSGSGPRRRLSVWP